MSASWCIADVGTDDAVGEVLDFVRSGHLVEAASRGRDVAHWPGKLALAGL